MKLLKRIKAKLTSFFTKPPYLENKQLLERFKYYNRAVVLGSGPTINNLELSNFSLDTLVISMGNFYEHPEIKKINPSIHIFAASHPPITENVLVNWWTRCNEILPLSIPIMVEGKDKTIAERIFTNREVFFYSYGGSFPVDFTKKIMSPWSVTQVGLQLAIYVKIKEVYLLGVNHDWQHLMPYAHFYSHDKPSLEYYLQKENILIEYEDRTKPLPKERLYGAYNQFKTYEMINNFAKTQKVSIYNGDPLSTFDIFDKKVIKF
jgi:hypothetical protein